MSDIPERIGQKYWFSRIVALIYMWTIGLVIGVIFVSLAFIYALLGTVLQLLDAGSQSDIPFWKPVKGVFQWWFSWADHAFTGTGVPALLPPMIR